MKEFGQDVESVVRDPWVDVAIYVEVEDLSQRLGDHYHLEFLRVLQIGWLGSGEGRRQVTGRIIPREWRNGKPGDGNVCGEKVPPPPPPPLLQCRRLQKP